MSTNNYYKGYQNKQTKIVSNVKSRGDNMFFTVNNSNNNDINIEDDNIEPQNDNLETLTNPDNISNEDIFSDNDVNEEETPEEEVEEEIKHAKLKKAKDLTKKVTKIVLLKKLLKKILAKKVIIIALTGGVALFGALFFIIFLTALKPYNMLDLTKWKQDSVVQSGTAVTGGGTGGVPIGPAVNPLNGMTILEALGEEKFNEINANIRAAAINCSKEGLVGVASALINGVSGAGYGIPYYWAGGHGSNSNPIGINPNWGRQTSGSFSGQNTYYYEGLDCSGFINWCLKNTNVNAEGTTTTFMNHGTQTSFAAASPGDLLVNDGHVMLIIENNGSSFIVAESTPSMGVGFSSYNLDYLSSRYGVFDMSNYLSSNCMG